MPLVISRRRFLSLGAVSVAAIVVPACSANPPYTGGPGATSSAGSNDSASSTAAPPLSSAPSSSSVPVGQTGFESPSAAVIGAARKLVIVQLNGGNDALNTLVPADGRYHDLRPTLGLGDDQVIALPGADEWRLHAALAPLTSMWAAGSLAMIPGIGFENPDRSHFVAMDRWWRADDHARPGWLGRLLDSFPQDPDPLMATSLAGSAPLLIGARRQGTAIGSAESFRFSALGNGQVAAFGVSPEFAEQPGSAEITLSMLAGIAYQKAALAVDGFASVVVKSPVEPADADPAAAAAAGAASITDGLLLAAQLLTGNPASQIVVVSASGFDTHSNQAPVHQALLADLAVGLQGFFAAIDQAGMSDDVLLVTTSEFGRRVAENGSGGCDHGAAGVSFAMGAAVRGGVYGSFDLGNLLDGDLRPSHDPRALYTACLDWLGADVDAVLDRRYDDLAIFR